MNIEYLFSFVCRTYSKARNNLFYCPFSSDLNIVDTRLKLLLWGNEI